MIFSWEHSGSTRLLEFLLYVIHLKASSLSPLSPRDPLLESYTYMQDYKLDDKIDDDMAV